MIKLQNLYVLPSSIESIIATDMEDDDRLVYLIYVYTFSKMEPYVAVYNYEDSRDIDLNRVLQSIPNYSDPDNYDMSYGDDELI